MKRYQYLDVARGFGLLLVIISHSCGLSRFLINYYIPLFFVVSGYIYKEGRSYKENIEHKAKRLLIPYFGYSAVLLAVYVLMGRTLAETKASAFGILYSRYCLYDTTVVKDNVYLFTVANGKITIIGGDGGSNGVDQVAGNVPAVMAKLFESMKEATGIDLADIVKADTYDAKVNRNVNVSGIDSVNLVVKDEKENPTI